MICTKKLAGKIHDKNYIEWLGGFLKHTDHGGEGQSNGF